MMISKLRFVLPLFLLLCLSAVNVAYAKGDFYQIKIYHLKSAEQEKTVDAFLENAYLPALHRNGIKDVGVFKLLPSKEGTGELAENLIYVFIPFKSKADFFKLEGKLEADKKLAAEGKAYLDAIYTNPPFERIETILLEAFTKHPNYVLPLLKGPKAERVYELRSYEGPTEKISANKIDMFNTGDEMGLFKRLGFNGVFYAKVIAGSTMPNLMYLTTFENVEERDKHWAAFSKDDYWQKLSKMPQYQHNVSKNVTKFLRPTDYSDI